MADNLVKARWVGPFDAEIGPGIVLEHGDEHEVTADDLLSSHWEPVGTDAKKAAKQVAEAHEEQAKSAETATEPEPPRDAGEDGEPRE